jgi:hypothetical protein
MATLHGRPVDRPAVCFYEIGGFDVNPDDPDPFNIYNDPSWRPLLKMAEERTDLIRMRGPVVRPGAAGKLAGDLYRHETWMEGPLRFTRTTLTIGGRVMTALDRRDPDMDTTWVIEHLLKGPEDLEAYLQIPDEAMGCEVDTSNVLAAEQEVGDRGIVMIDTGDPICAAAPLMSMEDFTVLAMTEGRQFHRLLGKVAPAIWDRTERIAAALPGRLWRICGPEYATEPYLPPRLFDEYVVRYTRPMIESIHRHGGFARVHCHGRLKAVLPFIAAMGADATDPVEPPPLGDVELADVRRQYGHQLVLFGNLELRDIETLPPAEFEQVVARSLRDGTAGAGRGFVLMPSACPCGRHVTPRAVANYQTMVRLTTGS